MDRIILALSIPVVQQALIGMLIAGASLSLLGVVIVSLNLTAIRFSFMHLGLLGAAAGLGLGFSPGAGAFILVVVAALAMGVASRQFEISKSSIMGLFMTGSLAGAFILLSVTSVPAMQVFSVFTGNILLLSKTDLWLITGLGITVILTFTLAFREIQLVLADEQMAQALGVPVGRIVVGLFLLVGLSVAAALRLVGALLVDSIILLPGITALLFVRSFRGALILSSAFGFLSCGLGFLLAVLLDLPIGATTAAVSATVLGAGMVIAKFRHH